MSRSSFSMEGGQEAILMYVVDVLRYDIENVTSIVKMLNDEGCIGWRTFWHSDFTADEVTEALGTLYRKGMVKALRVDASSASLVDTTLSQEDLPNLHGFWFALTKKGRMAWDKWEPPTGP